MAAASPSASELLKRFRELDIPTRLNHDQYPTEEERDEVAEMVKNAQEQAVLQKDELQSLRSQLETLEREIEELGVHAAKGKAFVRAQPSLIGRLPDELLCEIFSQLSDSCLDDSQKESKWYVMGRNLELVSSRWHRVAQSLPVLWSRISLTIRRKPEHCGNTYKREQQRLMSLVQLLLDRSRDHPLDIYVDIRFNDTLHPHPAYTSLWSSCKRWRSVYLNDHDINSWFGGTCNDELYSLPQLKSAALSITSVDLWQRFLTAPRLRSVRLFGEAWDGIPDEFDDEDDRSFPQIVDVDLDFAEWPASLKLFPNVQSVTLHLTEDYPTGDEETCSLPNSCHSLTLIIDPDAVDTDGEYISEQLEVIRAPKITSLALKTGHSDHKSKDFTDFPFSALKGFIKRSGCKIAALEIDQLYMSWETLCRFFQLLSDTLVHLRIYEMRYKKDSDIKPIFDDLFVFMLKAGILPKLKTMILNVDKFKVKHELVRGMIVGCADRGLEKFTLHIDGGIFNPVAYKLLQDFPKDELSVQIVGPCEKRKHNGQRSEVMAFFCSCCDSKYRWVRKKRVQK